MNTEELGRAIAIQKKRIFTIEDIPLVTRVFEDVGLTRGTNWDYFSGTTMALPDWFDFALSPDSKEYKDQQLNLWMAISGSDRQYSPKLDEMAEKRFSNPSFVPGWYSWRSDYAIENASNHISAMASILRHSGVRPGDRLLEYGAGSGEIALAFSRLGVQVDTVDISPDFCRHVQSVSDFYRTNLTAFNGEFGDNPRGGNQKYSFILFYEAFHHALDFIGVAKKISSYLLPGARIMLAGEPIVDKKCPAIPYEWGLRLDAETIVVMRSRGWLELGFLEDYICAIFTDNKLNKKIIKEKDNQLSNLYIFERVDDNINYKIKELDFFDGASDLIKYDNWYEAQLNGRWTKKNSFINLSNLPASEIISFEMENPLPAEKNVSISLDGCINYINIGPKELGKITMETGKK